MNRAMLQNYPPVLDKLSHRQLLDFIFSVSVRNKNTFVENKELSGILGSPESTYSIVYTELFGHDKQGILEYTKEAFKLEIDKKHAQPTNKQKTYAEVRDELHIFLYGAICSIIKKYSNLILSKTSDLKFIKLCADTNLDAPCHPAQLHLYYEIFSLVWDKYCIHNHFNPEQAKFIQNGDIFCKLHYLEVGTTTPKTKLTSVSPEVNLSYLEALCIPERGNVSLFFETSCGLFFKILGLYDYYKGADMLITLNYKKESAEKQYLQFPLLNIHPLSYFSLNIADCVSVQFSEEYQNFYTHPVCIGRVARNLKVYDFPTGITKNKFVKDKTFVLDFGAIAPLFLKNYGKFEG